MFHCRLLLGTEWMQIGTYRTKQFLFYFLFGQERIADKVNKYLHNFSIEASKKRVKFLSRIWSGLVEGVWRRLSALQVKWHCSKMEITRWINNLNVIYTQAHETLPQWIEKKAEKVSFWSCLDRILITAENAEKSSFCLWAGQLSILLRPSENNAEEKWDINTSEKNLKQN